MERPKILVAEDSPLFQNIIEDILDTLGYDAKITNDGMQVIDIIEGNEHNFVAVFLDIYMPKVDGISTLGHLRSHYPSLPILVLSGSNDVEDIKTIAKLGAHKYIDKSKGRDVVLNEIKKSLKDIMS